MRGAKAKEEDAMPWICICAMEAPFQASAAAVEGLDSPWPAPVSTPAWLRRLSHDAGGVFESPMHR